jgi:GTPase SAR1 family protein
MFDKYVFAAHVVFICYDVTDLQSFSDAEDWFRLVENGSRNLDFKRMHQYLVGNKIDLVAQRVVSSEKHDEFIRKHKMNSGFLVSARNGDNVLKAVYRVAAEAARIQVTEYELSFCDSIIRTTLSLDGECDSARTAMADQIEAEDLAAEKSKQSAFQSGCLCSIM